jgi:alcohol dehydrogenase class IV
MRDESRRTKAGGSGAVTVAVVYEPALTIGLPRAETVGTGMNALAHCAESLYAGPCEDATAGAGRIAEWLPIVAAHGDDPDARRGLLEGAMYAGMALAERGLFLAHAMAQALGGRYGVSHGAMNALCLPPALRFNAATVPHAVDALAAALGADDAPKRVEQLAGLGSFGRLRDFDVPEADLPEVAEATASRPAARSNPRPASVAEIEVLLRGIW